MLSWQNLNPGKKEPKDMSRAHSWRMLWLAFFYRLILSLLLLVLFFTETRPLFLGSHNPALFALVSIGYFGLVAASGIPMYLHSPNPQRQSWLQVYLDIIAITLLMHASGGVTTGLGMLLLISIAYGSAVMRGRTALAFSAIASICLLGEQLYSHLTASFATTAYTQAGILGASFFAVAILADALSKRLRETEQIASQRELDMANLEQLNDYIIQHIQAGIIVVDLHDRIRLMNEYAWYLLGMPDTTTGQLLSQASPELDHIHRQWLPDGNAQPIALQITPGQRELQAKFTLLGEKQRSGTMIYIEDMATLSHRAQQLKLASLGRLTVSIAHEIRNPLGAISHAQQLLGESERLDQADLRLGEIIGTNVERVNEIIESVMKLSRRQQSNPVQINLANWIESFQKEFIHDNKLNPEQMLCSIQPPDTIVESDPVQLRQLVTNLCENSISHFHLEPDTLRIRISGGINESGLTFLEFIDNGPGIKQDVARQIFEPFYTTRNAGTGLGLYIAKELSEANGLELEYKPAPKGGSCFIVSFPGVQPKNISARNPDIIPDVN